MRSRFGAPLALAAARLRRHPGRWLAPAAGIALAVAFGAAGVGEGTIAGDPAARGAPAGGGGTSAGDGAARRTLKALPPSARTVRLTWSGGLTPAAERRGRRL